MQALYNAVYAGLAIVGTAALMLAWVSTPPDLETCMKTHSESVCRYALR